MFSNADGGKMLSVAFFLLSVNIVLLHILKNVNSSSYKKVKSEALKGSGALLVAVFVFCGYMYFFKAHSFQFECQKETMKCVYSSSSEYNKELKPVKTYDISLIERADVRRYKTGKRSFRYHVILIRRNASVIKTPIKLSIKSEALREAERFNHFLYSSQNHYAYIKFPSETSLPESSFIVGMILIYFSLFSLLSRIIKGFRNPSFPIKAKKDDKPFPSLHEKEILSIRDDDVVIRRTKDI